MVEIKQLTCLKTEWKFAIFSTKPTVEECNRYSFLCFTNVGLGLVGILNPL